MATLEASDPNALSSCPGWTAHHIAAHICGNYEEIRRHVEAVGEGRPLEQTRGWDEREAPLRELELMVLLGRIDSEATRAGTAIDDVLENRPETELTWTGRTVRLSGFSTHLRSENALHRWDLVGDDETSLALLGQEELLAHAASFIGQPLLRRGLAGGAGDAPFVARVRSAGQADLVVEAGDDQAQLSLQPVTGDAALEGDAGERLLLLWGRKPMPFNRLRVAGALETATRVQALLSGY